MWRTIKFQHRHGIGLDRLKGGQENGPIAYPVLVSHNGTNFDFPILRFRGILYRDKLSDEGIRGLKVFLDAEDKWEDSRANYFSKASRFHVDTCQFFGGSKISLKELCALYGINTKTTASGNQVEELFRKGEFEVIGKYCAEDVLGLARVFNLILQAKGEEGLVLPSGIEDCELEVMR